MKMSFLVGAWLMILSGFSPKVWAADGSSGCGVSWYIIKENSLLSSAGRFITNWVLWPISSLGMTFGTSNCAKHSLVEQNKKSLHFATKSLDVIRHDLAKGSGVHSSNFVATFGCYETVRPLVIQRVREELQRNPVVLESPELPALLVMITQKAIHQEPYLAMQCA